MVKIVILLAAVCFAQVFGLPTTRNETEDEIIAWGHTEVYRYVEVADSRIHQTEIQASILGILEQVAPCIDGYKAQLIYLYEKVFEGMDAECVGYAELKDTQQCVDGFIYLARVGAEDIALNVPTCLV